MKRAEVMVEKVSANCPDCGSPLTNDFGEYGLEVWDKKELYRCGGCENFYGLPLILYRTIESEEE